MFLKKKSLRKKGAKIIKFFKVLLQFDVFCTVLCLEKNVQKKKGEKS